MLYPSLKSLWKSFLCVFLLSQIANSQEKQLQKNFGPNIIIFIADDISWDDLGCYGNSFVQTPNIDSLATTGIRFNNALLTTSSCSPSRISIMTGRYPHNTGAAELHTEPRIDFESMASRLKSNGYYTGQGGKWHMGSLLKKGFHQIHDTFEKNGDGGEDLWVPSLRNRKENMPFFFWFASYDAHRPWGENEFSNVHTSKGIEVPKTLVDNDSTQMDLSSYYNEIKRLDFHIGEVVKELKKQGVFDNTLILILSDNGRPFPRDKTRLYHSGIRTPLIVAWPKVIKKGISNSLISSIDIAPTILDICNVDIPLTFQGKSFKSLFSDPSIKIRDYAFAEHNWHDHEAHERMICTTEFIYILNSRPQFPNQGPADAIASPSFRSLATAYSNNLLTPAQSDIFTAPRPKEELFYVPQDPMQLNNLIGERRYNLIHKKLKNKLRLWIKWTGDNVPKNLTKDWYSRKSDQKIETNFEIRGEMPGQKLKADLNNRKLKF